MLSSKICLKLEVVKSPCTLDQEKGLAGDESPAKYSKHDFITMMQVYPRDSFGNPCTALPNVSFSGNSSRAALTTDGRRVEVTYIPNAYEVLPMDINFTIPGA